LHNDETDLRYIDHAIPANQFRFVRLSKNIRGRKKGCRTKIQYKSYYVAAYNRNKNRSSKISNKGKREFTRS